MVWIVVFGFGVVLVVNLFGVFLWGVFLWLLFVIEVFGGVLLYWVDGGDLILFDLIIVLLMDLVGASGDDASLGVVLFVEFVGYVFVVFVVLMI